MNDSVLSRITVHHENYKQRLSLLFDIFFTLLTILIFTIIILLNSTFLNMVLEVHFIFLFIHFNDYYYCYNWKYLNPPLFSLTICCHPIYFDNMNRSNIPVQIE